MDEKIKPPQLTEPVPIDCVFTEGVDIEIRDEVVRAVFWVDLEKNEIGQLERRIVGRVVMPLIVARAFIRDLRISIGRGGH